MPRFGASLADAVMASCAAHPFFDRVSVPTSQDAVNAIDGGFAAGLRSSRPNLSRPGRPPIARALASRAARGPPAAQVSPGWRESRQGIV